MRTVKAVLLLMLMNSMFGVAGAEQGDINDISDYYGFDEIEIVKLDREIKCLRIADFNRDGRSDIAVVNNRKAKIEVLLQKEGIGPGEMPVAVDPEDVDINSIKPMTRFDRQSVAVSQKVASFVCGDLNSDGMVDLAFYGEPKGLYIILQKPAEEKADKKRKLSWRARKKIKIDDGLTTSESLACADLNNDGRDDLALAGRDVVYIIEQEKDGSLAEPVKYPTTARTLGVEVGDLNGDKINDLILVTNDVEKLLHVRFGLKSGQLGPQVKFFIEKPYALNLHNLDGRDGDEIVTVDRRSGRLICYAFASEDEPLKSDADWPILFYPLKSGEENTKRDLIVADFDGDRLTDIVISEPGAAELIFYKQEKGLGLAEPVRFPALADIESLSAADIDRDGKAELGVVSVKEKLIGLSHFEDERLSFPQPLETVGEPLAMELADIDRDKNIDCVYICKDNDARYLRVVYDVGKASKVKSKSSSGIESEVDETKQGLELKGLVANPEGLKVVDVDQDGLEDVLIFVQYEDPILVRQRQVGEFKVVDSPGAQSSLIKEAKLSSIAVADVDGKAGKELLVAQKNFARSLVFSGGQSWTVVDQYNAKGTENRISAVAAFDISGKKGTRRPSIFLLDGQQGQLQILRSGDDKTYRFAKEVNVDRWNPAAHLKILFEPVTGGKARSIMLFDSEKFALITPPSVSKGRQYLEEQFSYDTKIKDGTYGNLTSGDINSDKRADIIMVECMRNHIEILALDSDIKPLPAMRFKIFETKSYRDSKRGDKSSVEPRELKIADVTGDDKDDLVTIIHDRIIVYPQD